jgi:hypothetical protein
MPTQLHCPRCSTFYCCTEHQKEDWPYHKLSCMATSAAVPQTVNVAESLETGAWMFGSKMPWLSEVKNAFGSGAYANSTILVNVKADRKHPKKTTVSDTACELKNKRMCPRHFYKNSSFREFESYRIRDGTAMMRAVSDKMNTVLTTRRTSSKGYVEYFTVGAKDWMVGPHEIIWNEDSDISQDELDVFLKNPDSYPWFSRHYKLVLGTAKTLPAVWSADDSDVAMTTDAMATGLPFRKKKTTPTASASVPDPEWLEVFKAAMPTESLSATFIVKRYIPATLKPVSITDTGRSEVSFTGNGFIELIDAIGGEDEPAWFVQEVTDKLNAILAQQPGLTPEQITALTCKPRDWNITATAATWAGSVEKSNYIPFIRSGLINSTFTMFKPLPKKKHVFWVASESEEKDRIRRESTASETSVPGKSVSGEGSSVAPSTTTSTTPKAARMSVRFNDPDWLRAFKLSRLDKSTPATFVVKPYGKGKLQSIDPVSELSPLDRLTPAKNRYVDLFSASAAITDAEAFATEVNKRINALLAEKNKRRSVIPGVKTIKYDEDPKLRASLLDWYIKGDTATWIGSDDKNQSHLFDDMSLLNYNFELNAEFTNLEYKLKKVGVQAFWVSSEVSQSKLQKYKAIVDKLGVLGKDYLNEPSVRAIFEYEKYSAGKDARIFGDLSNWTLVTGVEVTNPAAQKNFLVRFDQTTQDLVPNKFCVAISNINRTTNGSMFVVKLCAAINYKEKFGIDNTLNRNFEDCKVATDDWYVQPNYVVWRGDPYKRETGDDGCGDNTLIRSYIKVDVPAGFPAVWHALPIGSIRGVGAAAPTDAIACEGRPSMKSGWYPVFTASRVQSNNPATFIVFAEENRPAHLATETFITRINADDLDNANVKPNWFMATLTRSGVVDTPTLFARHASRLLNNIDGVSPAMRVSSLDWYVNGSKVYWVGTPEKNSYNLFVWSGIINASYSFFQDSKHGLWIGSTISPSKAKSVEKKNKKRILDLLAPWKSQSLASASVKGIIAMFKSAGLGAGSTIIVQHMTENKVFPGTQLETGSLLVNTILQRISDVQASPAAAAAASAPSASGACSISTGDWNTSNDYAVFVNGRLFTDCDNPIVTKMLKTYVKLDTPVGAPIIWQAITTSSIIGLGDI